MLEYLLWKSAWRLFLKKKKLDIDFPFDPAT